MDAYLKELLFRSQKCDDANADDGVMIPMCHTCFAGDIIMWVGWGVRFPLIP